MKASSHGHWKKTYTAIVQVQVAQAIFVTLTFYIYKVNVWNFTLETF